MRIKIIRIAIIFLFVGITTSLFHTQIIRGNVYYGLSKNNRIRVVSIAGRRGRILDRNGVVMAGNRLSFDVMVVPQEIDDKDSLFEYLSDILDTDKEKLLESFKKSTLAPFAPVTVAQDIARETVFILEENSFRFPGLIVQASSRRDYPFREINAHLLGYVGKITQSRMRQLKDYGYTVPNIIGYSGVEEYYDGYLGGEDGGLQIEVNSRGQQVRLLGVKEPHSGQNITLSVDNKIQQMAFEVLEEEKGAVIVMDLNTGEILGMASKPAFDPNIFVEENTDKKIASFFSDKSAPLLNRVIGGQYPPGSTFKIPLSICALTSKKIRPETTFSCPGYFTLGRRSFRCSHVHGVQNLTEAIGHSCNVYFYNVGLLVGPELMGEYAKLFGLGQSTGIDIPYEAKGLVPSSAYKRSTRKEGWYKGDTLNFSIGQGDVMVTPIQLVNMVATVANDGKYVRPHVLKAIGSSHDAESDSFIGQVDVDQEVFDVVKAGMRAAVGDYSGTAHLLDIKSIKVLGKTGTAQTSGGRASHAWFVGFCPSAKTKIAFCVFLEHGGSSYRACQVARTLLLKMYKEGML